MNEIRVWNIDVMILTGLILSTGTREIDRDIVVGIATPYGLVVTWIEYR